MLDRLDKCGILCCDLTVNRVIDKTLAVENSNQFHGKGESVGCVHFIVYLLFIMNLIPQA